MPPSICWPYCANGPENSPTIPTFTTFCARETLAIASSAPPASNLPTHVSNFIAPPPTRPSTAWIGLAFWPDTYLFLHPSSFPVHLREHLLGPVHRRVRRRNARVNR